MSETDCTSLLLFNEDFSKYVDLKVVLYSMNEKGLIDLIKTEDSYFVKAKSITIQ